MVLIEKCCFSVCSTGERKHRPTNWGEMVSGRSVRKDKVKLSLITSPAKILPS